MVVSFTVSQNELLNNDYCNLYFAKDGVLQNDLDCGFPKCIITLRKNGSMRFKWNLTNSNRQTFFNSKFITLTKSRPVPVELIHSKTVYSVSNEKNTLNLLGDGIITDNKSLAPTVTVADCMPIFIYDSKKNVFGVVHSGWKGTGIIEEFIKKAQNEYGSNPEDLSVIIGPHIRDCCYIVDKERRDYFASNFTRECVYPTENENEFYLSLEKANLYLLKKNGVKEENISIAKHCTCCDKTEAFGSFRRETKDFKHLELQEQFNHFSPMSAIIFF